MTHEPGSLDSDREERIRRRAHQIWDESGRPEGRHEEHWRQASADIDAEDDTTRSDAPMTAATWKPRVDAPSAEGLPSDTPALGGDDGQVSPDTPKTSGAAASGKEPLVNPVADRNVEGVRQAGMTPRPTDKPISGRRGSA